MTTSPDNKGTSRIVFKKQNAVSLKYQTQNTPIEENNIWKAFNAVKSLIKNCDCGCTSPKECRNLRLRKNYYSFRDYLIQSYIKYFKRTACIMIKRRRWPSNRIITFNDSICSGVLGGIQAIETYDLEHCSRASFVTYSYTRIRGEIIDEFRRIQDFSSIVTEMRKCVYPKIEAITQAIGHFPSLEDLKDGMSDKEFMLCLNPLLSSSVVAIGDNEADSLDGTVVSQVRKSFDSRGKIDVNSLDLDIILQDSSLVDVIYMYYYLGMPVNEIAMVMNISIGGVSKKKTAAELKIREFFKTKQDMINHIYE